MSIAKRLYALALALALLAAVSIASAAGYDAVVVNESPVAVNFEIETYRNMTVSGVLRVSDDKSGAVCQVLTMPKYGVLTVQDYEFVYTPYQNRTGTDYFTYIARDADGSWSEEAEVTIDIKKPEAAATYRDMDGNPAEYASALLAERGIYTGREMGGESYFEPDAEVSRGEFLAMVMQAAGYEPAVAASTEFADDASIPAWTRMYVAEAVRDGIVTGDGSAETGYLMRAEDAVTAAEAAVMCDRAVKPEDTSVTAADAPEWASGALSRLQAAGIMDGGDAMQTLSRAEAARIIAAIIGRRDAQSVTTGLFSWVTMS